MEFWGILCFQAGQRGDGRQREHAGGHPQREGPLRRAGPAQVAVWCLVQRCDARQPDGGRREGRVRTTSLSRHRWAWSQSLTFCLCLCVCVCAGASTSPRPRCSTWTGTTRWNQVTEESGTPTWRRTTSKPSWCWAAARRGSETRTHTTSKYTRVPDLFCQNNANDPNPKAPSSTSSTCRKTRKPWWPRCRELELILAKAWCHAGSLTDPSPEPRTPKSSDRWWAAQWASSGGRGWGRRRPSAGLDFCCSDFLSQ